MAKTSTLNIRIEPKLKEETETTLNDVGMNIADACNNISKTSCNDR